MCKVSAAVAPWWGGVKMLLDLKVVILMRISKKVLILGVFPVETASVGFAVVG